MDTRDSITKQILAGTFDRNRSIKKLRADGMTYRAIGLFYGLSKQRVYKIVTNPFNNATRKRHQPSPGQEGGLIRKLVAKVKRLFNTDISIGG